MLPRLVCAVLSVYLLAPSRALCRMQMLCDVWLCNVHVDNTSCMLLSGSKALPLHNGLAKWACGVEGFISLCILVE